MKSATTISVIGTGYSGSGAVFDYLQSSLMAYFPLKDVEYLLPHCPGGLMNLYAGVYKTQYASVSNINDSVERFIKVSSLLYRNNGLFSKGMNYNKLLPDFLENVWCLIDQCFVRDYAVDIYFDWLQMPPLKRLKERFSSSQRFCFSPIDGIDFPSAVRQFHENLFHKSHDSVIILNQSMNYLNIDCARNFFPGHKTILVTRNPFDQYADLKLKKNFRGLEKFIRMYKTISSRLEVYSLLPDILHVKFEDLVLDFEETASKINNFTNLDVPFSTKNFDPQNSETNVGFYKKVLSEGEIDCLLRHFSRR